MKLFFNYLKSRRGIILAYLLFAVIFTLSFILYRLPIMAVLYPIIICASLGLIFLIQDFFKAKKKHESFEIIKTLSAAMIDTLPEPKTVEEADCVEIIKQLCTENVAIETANSTRYRDTVDYYTVWAHQIKTPIASMKLSLQNEDTPLSRKLYTDLNRIEQYVEMVLVFLRLDSNSSDYVLARYSLDKIVRQSVKKLAPDLINKKIRLNYEPIDGTTVTDEKWLSFVIEQIFSNAVKYTHEGGEVKIYMRDGNTLCIEDTGIGIAPEDLPRIFEKGYTGCNGRVDRSASGIGLYLCKRICNNLGIVISAQSELSEGTIISLEFDQEDFKIE